MKIINLNFILLVHVQRAYHTCKCLPSCTDIDYELSYSTVPKNFSYIKESFTFLDNLTDRYKKINFFIN